VGTSGYNYLHWWDGVFYPQDLPQRKWLEYYSDYFDTVELNVTFYRLPRKETFASWYRRTGKNFLFAVKGSRFITHIKRLRDCEDSLHLFFNNASPLREKLGVVLWQLPPSLKKDSQRLKDFSSLLKELGYHKFRHAFEFRHPSWFEEEIYQILREHNFSLCIAHSSRWKRAEVLTADFLYLRFHGGEILYGSNYSEEELKEWAEKVKRWSKEITLLFAYFNNDAYGYAVKNALYFRKLLQELR